MEARGPARWLGRAGWLVLGLLPVAGLFFALQGREPETEAPPSAPPVASALPPSPDAVAELDGHALSLPSGELPRLSCEEAREVVSFLARELAAPPITPTPSELASLWAALLDPHGLWSAAPDSPLRTTLEQAAPDMLRELQGEAAGCAAAELVGNEWQAWLAELAPIYDAAFEQAQAEPLATRAAVHALVAEPIFEDDPVTRPGRELSRELGRRLGAFAARFPEQASLVDQARARFFPARAQVLAEVSLLAALRSYVPLVDPHGDFAALDEEWALYAGDSTLDAGSPLWADIARTPLGARIVADPAPPLELDDVVLAIDGFGLAGASVDQIEQAARSGGEHQVALSVLRQGELKQLTLFVDDEARVPGEALRVERIPYGSPPRFVLRVVIPDVSDDLAETLAELLQREAPGSGAVLLDLRGNGGGSLDAAVAALGLLLPGARLFPLVQRGLVTEVLQAPRTSRPYVGPIAALVDGDTASAAEMLAGAVQAYERGLVVGARTFGKGCVQEYFDRVAPSGVLRMTTLQFVMPDGRPLQQIGLTPDLTLPLPPALEREAHLARQPITFEGPDVRDRSIPRGPSWPRDSAAAGPCEDPVVCSAIARLARAPSPRKKGKGPVLDGGGLVPRDTERAARPRPGTR